MKAVITISYKETNMQYYGKAQEAAQDILEAFKSPNGLPKPLARIFVRRRDHVPCNAWSWRNRLIVALHGYSDARTFRQWQQVGRHVQKNEKAFRILQPVTKKTVDEKTGEERRIVYGFRGLAVFGLEQTEGDPVRSGDPAIESWIASLPLLEVAQSWGLSVEAFNGTTYSCLGRYTWGQGIALGVKNLATWTHELVHAADQRNGNLRELGQHWRSETVAELGGAVLLQVIGLEHDSDLGGCWDYFRWYAEKQEIEVLDACGKVLKRVCEAVALILDTAERLQPTGVTSAPTERTSCTPPEDYLVGADPQLWIAC
jgi:hypothetical protein